MQINLGCLNLARISSFANFSSECNDIHSRLLDTSLNTSSIPTNHVCMYTNQYFGYIRLFSYDTSKSVEFYFYNEPFIKSVVNCILCDSIDNYTGGSNHVITYSFSSRAFSSVSVAESISISLVLPLARSLIAANFLRIYLNRMLMMTFPVPACM